MGETRLRPWGAPSPTGLAHTTCARTHTHTHKCARVHVHAHKRKHRHTRTHSNTHGHVHKLTHTHRVTHTPSHTRTCVQYMCTPTGTHVLGCRCSCAHMQDMQPHTGHTHTHVCAQAHRHAHMQAHTPAHPCMYTANSHAHTLTCVHTHIHVHVCACVRAHTDTGRRIRQARIGSVTRGPSSKGCYVRGRKAVHCLRPGQGRLLTSRCQEEERGTEGVWAGDWAGWADAAGPAARGPGTCKDAAAPSLSGPLNTDSE